MLGNKIQIGDRVIKGAEFITKHTKAVLEGQAAEGAKDKFSQSLMTELDGLSEHELFNLAGSLSDVHEVSAVLMQAVTMLGMARLVLRTAPQPTQARTNVS